MSEFESLPPDPILGADVHLARCIVDLADAYCAIVPGKTKEDFSREIYSELENHADLSTVAMIEAALSGGRAVVRHVSVVIGCTCCIQALRFVQQGKMDSAWSKTADARYWTAVAKVSAKAPELQAELMKEARRTTASTGGIGKAEKKFGQTKEKAFALARELVRTWNGPRLSRRQVALRIEKQVLDFARSVDSPMSEGHETIYNWLKNMPDASILFPRIDAPRQM